MLRVRDGKGFRIKGVMKLKNKTTGQLALAVEIMDPFAKSIFTKKKKKRLQGY